MCWETLADDFFAVVTRSIVSPQYTGQRPSATFNRLRLITARHLLRHTDESASLDIAYRCGFGDSNHFSILFAASLAVAALISVGKDVTSVTRRQSPFYCRKKANNVRLFTVEVVVRLPYLSQR
ncbi:helix-turn-helix domain-containing protein [Enterobacter cloacae subsp. cloacae]|nr:helix-turn-helix domain-containing protein [Enterobacter cloacae subsp. cloacae]